MPEEPTRNGIKLIHAMASKSFARPIKMSVNECRKNGLSAQETLEHIFCIGLASGIALGQVEGYGMPLAKNILEEPMLAGMAGVVDAYPLSEYGIAPDGTNIVDFWGLEEEEK